MNMSGYVLQTDADHEVAAADREQFEELGAALVRVRSRTEFVDAASRAVAVLNSGFRLTAELIELLKCCRVISRYGSGVDNIDVAAATRQGIPVANVPVFCIEEVANRAFTLLLACSCELLRLDHRTRSGIWGVQHLPYAAQIEDRVLGLIGYGRIGRAVARRAKPFGLSVIAFDPFLAPEAPAAEGVTLHELDELLTLADYVSLHTPLTAQTLHLIDARRLRLMKPSAFLINTARGALIDELALLDALTSRRIAGAGLDVFEDEPPARYHPLLQLENVIVTPHCAAHTHLANEKVERGAIRAILAVLRGERPPDVVNPDVFSGPAASAGAQISAVRVS